MQRRAAADVVSLMLGTWPVFSLKRAASESETQSRAASRSIEARKSDGTLIESSELVCSSVSVSVSAISHLCFRNGRGAPYMLRQKHCRAPAVPFRYTLPKQMARSTALPSLTKQMRLSNKKRRELRMIARYGALWRRASRSFFQFHLHC